MIWFLCRYLGALNPYAQYQKKMSVEEVLADKLISWPLTRAMCAPIGDGAAAAILCSEDYLHNLSKWRAIKVLASILGSGADRSIDADTEDIAYRVCRQAYEVAGLAPKDIDIAECHDATAWGEVLATEAMGLCPPGDGGRLAESGVTKLGGKIPVNVSGGLESKGHPLGATGIYQIFELVVQLRGEAGKRQVEGARTGFAENAGGAIGAETAAGCAHIFQVI